jgi:uncharacterized membrane protein
LPYALVGVAVIAVLLGWLKPDPEPPVTQSAATSIAASASSTRATSQISYKTLETVLAQRCYLCHGAVVQMKNVRLDSPQNVKLYAQNIYQQAVVSKIMPMGNTTQISAAERQIIAQWFESGASVD